MLTIEERMSSVEDLVKVLCGRIGALEEARNRGQHKFHDEVYATMEIDRYRGTIASQEKRIKELEAQCKLTWRLDDNAEAPLAVACEKMEATIKKLKAELAKADDQCVSLTTERDKLIASMLEIKRLAISSGRSGS
jgi:predicted  nucleic acid-binding Zn-ribbon protein